MKINIALILLILSLFIPSPALAVSGACSWHGGVDCSAGADWDGSVICNDGWRDSSVYYYESTECSSSSIYIPTCQTVFYDKELMQSSLNYYQDMVLTYKDDLNRCINSFSNQTEENKNFCEGLWGLYINIYQACIDNSKLIAPVSCPNFSQFNFNTKKCECTFGYVVDNNQCINGWDYCKKYYGSSYRYVADSNTCLYDSSIEIQNGDKYCVEKHGTCSFFNPTTKQCGCYDWCSMNNNMCEEKNSQSKPIEPNYTQKIIYNDLNSEVTNREANFFKSKDENLINRLKGYILLQTEENGEAWYVDPATSQKYYMKDGPTAYEALRKFELGITDADLTKIPKEGSNDKGDQSLVSRLKGKILLQVQQNGEAWYVNPKDGKRYYLKNGEEAYRIMRLLSLGITNDNIRKIPVGNLENIK